MNSGLLGLCANIHIIASHNHYTAYTHDLLMNRLTAVPQTDGRTLEEEVLGRRGAIEEMRARTGLSNLVMVKTETTKNYASYLKDGRNPHEFLNSALRAAGALAFSRDYERNSNTLSERASNYGQIFSNIILTSLGDDNDIEEIVAVDPETHRSRLSQYKNNPAYPYLKLYQQVKNDPMAAHGAAIMAMSGTLFRDLSFRFHHMDAVLRGEENAMMTGFSKLSFHVPTKEELYRAAFLSDIPAPGDNMPAQTKKLLYDFGADPPSATPRALRAGRPIRSSTASCTALRLHRRLSAAAPTSGKR